MTHKFASDLLGKLIFTVAWLYLFLFSLFYFDNKLREITANAASRSADETVTLPPPEYSSQ